MTGNDKPLPPLTDEEIKWLRQQKSDYEHAKWALRVARRWIGYLVVSIGGMWAAFEALSRHFTWK